jgi:hypothetical protein
MPRFEYHEYYCGYSYSHDNTEHALSLVRPVCTFLLGHPKIVTRFDAKRSTMLEAQLFLLSQRVPHREHQDNCAGLLQRVLLGEPKV